jgi:uncharacterized OsmC-like protein
MKISASIKNAYNKHEAIVSTNDNQKILNIPGRTDNYGSSVNGGELLFLALATCFCNDIYREAAKRSMKINSVEINVEGEFGGEGDPASNIHYHTKIDAHEHSKQEINELIAYVDTVAEVHNTLRKGVHLSIKI